MTNNHQKNVLYMESYNNYPFASGFLLSVTLMRVIHCVAYRIHSCSRLHPIQLYDYYIFIMKVYGIYIFIIKYMMQYVCTIICDKYVYIFTHLLLMDIYVIP